MTNLFEAANDWISESARKQVDVERRHDPARLEALAVTRVQVAEFLESVAAAVIACDLLALMFVQKSPWVWLALAGLLIIAAPAFLVEGWLSREIASRLRTRAVMHRHEKLSETRQTFAATNVYLSRQRLMVLRQRGVGSDVCSALLTIVRTKTVEGAAEPVHLTGSDVLQRLDPLLGRERTDEVLSDVSRALA